MTAPFTRSRLLAGLVTFLVTSSFLVIGVSTAAHAATDPTLTRYPYLTDATQTSTTVNWATDTTGGTTGTVQFGPVGNCTANTVTATKTNITVISKAEYQWKAVLPTTPDTQYCYRVRYGSKDLLGSDPTPQFTSQVKAGSTAPFSFAVFGDWGQAYAGGVNADQTNVLAQMAKSGARFAVMTGDMAYPGSTQKEFGDLQQLGTDQSAVFGPTFWGVPGKSLPVYNVVGNHGFSQGAAQITNFPEQNTASASSGKYVMESYPSINGSTAKSYPSMWYAFDAGPARFYALTASWADANVGTGSVYQNDHDAHWTPTSAEYQWLKADLEAHPNALKFAFWHYPLYADSSGQPSDTLLQGGPGTLQGLLDANNVAIAFNGHAHGYERNKPDAAGLVSYVFGNGGAALGAVSGCSSYDLYAIGASNSHCGSATAQPNSEVFGFAKVTVNGRTVTVTPTSSTGRTYDIQTYTFPSSEPDSTAPKPPTTLTATAANANTVNLSWSGASDNVGVTGYQIYRAEGTGKPVLLAEQTGTETTGTTYSDTTASPATTYTYTVFAKDAAGNVSTSPATATVTTPGAPDTQAPSAPTNLSGTASSTGVVNLSWTASTDNVGVVGYNVYRNGTLISQPVTTTDPNPPTTFTDDTAQPSTTYTYAVEAVDAAGNVSTRATTSVTTGASQPADTTAPTQPANLAGTATGPTSVNLTWSASSDNVAVTGYRVYRGSGTTAIGSPTGTSFTDSSATAGTANAYSVTAVDAAGNESTRATVSVTTPSAGGGGTPTTVTLTPTDDAYVDSSVPTTNFGTNTRLTVDNSPQTNTLLKFNVTGLPASCPVTSASLKMTVGNSTNDNSPYGGDLYGVADTTWTQGAVNWGNQPAAAATKTSSVATSVALSTAYTWNATPLVTGNGLVSFAVKSTSSDGARYYSKEGAGATAALAPTLTVTCTPSGGSTADTTPPTTPGGLTATAAGANQVNLAWSASTDNVGVTGYQITRNGGTPVTVPGTARSYNDTGLSPNTAYTYSVVAVDAAGNKSAAATASATTAAATDTTPPTAPTGLAGTATGPTTVNLTWNQSTDNVGVTGYRIYRNGATSPTGTSTTTSFTDSGATAGTANTYAVTAVDAMGNESASATTSVTTPSAGGGGTPTTVTVTPVADSYTDSSVTGSNFGTGTLLTTDNSPASYIWLKFNVAGLPTSCPVTNAKLQLTVGSGSTDTSPYGGDLYGATDTSWVESGTGGITWATQPTSSIAATKTSSVATTVALSTPYTWDATPLVKGNGLVTLVVKSTSSDGARYWSKEGAGANNALKPQLTVTCTGSGGTTADTTPPSTPANLAGTATSSTSVNLTWGASTDNVGVTGYRVYRGTGTTPIGSPTGTSFTDTAATAGAANSYSVTAVDAAGNESPRATVSVTTPTSTDTTPPTAPTGLTGTATGPTTVNLTWGAATDNVGVTGYKVYRGGTTLIGSTTATARSFTDSGATAGTVNNYAVTAVDAAGNESTSATTSVTTPSAGGTGATTVTVTPVADSYTDSSVTGSNFGTGTLLTTDNSPVSYIWLKFNVAGLSTSCTVSNAKLQLTVGSGSTDTSPYGGDLYGATDTSWVESGTGGITWANQPTSSIAATKTSSVATTVALSTAYTWDATPLVKGNGLVTLVVKSTSSDGARYWSKEGAGTNNALKPQLTVTC